MSNPRRKHETMLAGHRLRIARILWLAFFLSSLAFYARGIPALQRVLAEPCQSSNCLTEQLTPQEASELNALGFSLADYASLEAILETATAIFSLAIGLAIFWRKRDDWMVMFVSVFVVGFGLSSGEVIEALDIFLPLSRSRIEAIEGIWGWVPLSFFLFLFPDGRFVPNWGRWLASAWGALHLLALLFPSSLISTANWSDSAQLLAFIGLMWLPGISAQIYRFRSVSTAIERQQTKFVVLGLSGTVVVAGVAKLLSFAFRDNAQLAVQVELGISILNTVGFLLIPLTIGLSVLRFRLWDIDPIINRALVYSTLTVILAVVFAGSIALVDQISGQVIGKGSAVLSAVVSTFFVGILFQPLRTRLEAWMIKRFYPEQLDLTIGIAEIEPPFWQVISLQQMLSIAAAHLRDSLDCQDVAIFLGPGDNPLEQDWKHATSGEKVGLSDFTPKELGELGRARVVLHNLNPPFVAYVPLYIVRRGENDVVGIIAIGPRAKQIGYSGADLKRLAEFGESLGKALYALRLRDRFPENQVANSSS